jgi:hypothetical protein
MLDFHFENVKRISPGFWGAIAGAAAAGATVFSTNRVLGGLVAGGAMFLVALKLTPCCDGCAQGQGCGDAKTAAPAAPGPAAVAEPSTRALLFDQPAPGTGNPFLNGVMRDADIVARRGLCS